MELVECQKLGEWSKSSRDKRGIRSKCGKDARWSHSGKAQADAYANLCKVRVEHRWRRTDGVKRGSIPEVSFDFCYTRARDSETKSARAVCWLVAIDSQTGYIHVAPLGSKNNFAWLIVQELMNFRSIVGVFSNHLQEWQWTHNQDKCWSDCSPQPRTHYKIEYFKAWRSFTSVREHSWQGEKACRKFHWRCAVKAWYQNRIRSCTLDLGSKTCQLGAE